MNNNIAILPTCVFFIGFALMNANVFSQEINQEINTITVKGVSFRQVLSQLLINGYAFEHLDSKANTVQTRFYKCTPKNALFNLSIGVRVQDSVAIITGRLCSNINNIRDGTPDSTNFVQVKYTYGPYKAAFLQMDRFARSFKAELIYSKTH
jgi:hypothetical protein